MKYATTQHERRGVESMNHSEVVRLGVYAVLIVLIVALAAFQALVMPEEFVVQAVWIWLQRALAAMMPMGLFLLGAFALALWCDRIFYFSFLHKLGLLTRVTLSLGILLWLIFTLGCLGVVSAWLGWLMGICGLVGIVAWACVYGTWSKLKHVEGYWFGWLPGLVLLSIAASVPAGFLWRIEALGYDACTYHLQLPRIWIEQGQITGLSYQVYSYLPNLFEAGYMQIILMQPNMGQAVVSSQWFHALWMLLFAGCLFDVGKAWGMKRAMGWAIGALLLLPWVLIAGSLAYNEAGMLALAAAMLSMILAIKRSHGWILAVCLGVAGGLAVMMKLTAGLMLVLPIMGIWLYRQRLRSVKWQHSVVAGVIFGLSVVVTMSPYLIRNAVETGNPIFPFASHLFGTGHWDAWQVAHWQAAHFTSAGASDIAAAWVRQWLTNPGYGAFGGVTSETVAFDIARFDQSYGIPIFWLLAIAGVVLAWRSRSHRMLAVGMVLMLLWQFLAWGLWSHLQSRFLIATVLPGCVLVGLAYLAWEHACVTWKMVKMRDVLPAVMLILLAVLSLTILWQQAPRITQTQDGLVLEQPLSLPIARLVQMDVSAEGHLLLEHIEQGDKLMLVGDYQRLIYLPANTRYASPFDQHPLGDTIEAAGGDPREIYIQLREQGVNWVWIHQGELERFNQTYGFDPRVTQAMLQELIRLAQRRIPVSPQSILLRLHD